MKLKAIHVFIILILALIFCCSLGDITEGMSNRRATVISGDKGAIIKGPNNTFVVKDASDPIQSGSPQATINGDSYSNPQVDDSNPQNQQVSSSSQQTNTQNQQGIPASQIPPGQEDLYILKSQVVPPVCPACPSPATCPRQEPCPACPACARCPEPNFTCKKVPNYQSQDTNMLPVPVLNDFSMFGM